MFCKKSVPRNFAKVTGKHLCQSLFFNKVEGAACNFIKKRLRHRCFPVKFVKFLRAPSLTEHVLWLFLANCLNKLVFFYKNCSQSSTSLIVYGDLYSCVNFNFKSIFWNILKSIRLKQDILLGPQICSEF